MVEIFPRVDVRESPRRDADLDQIERLDEAMDGKVDEARLGRDGGAQRVGSRHEGEVLPTSVDVDGDRTVWPHRLEQRLDRFGDIRVVTGQHNHACRGHVRQRGADAGGRPGQGRVLADNRGIADDRLEAAVPHHDDVRRIRHGGKRAGEQGQAVDEDRVLRHPTEPPSSAAGQHDRVEVVHRTQTRVAAMADPAAPLWRSEPVSFARRGGRLTERQQAAWDALAGTHIIDVPRLGLSTSVDPSFELDAAATFGRSAPLIIEIGSGRGESLVAAAKAQPDVNFLGLEVYVPGVAQTLVAMRHAGVENIRLAIVNAPEAFTTTLAPGSVREVRTWFPDPWHKARHHKRRLITEAFTELVARVLEPDTRWRIATDWDDYAQWITDVLATSPFVEGGPVPRFDGRPETRFERKGVAAGRVIHDFEARPRHRTRLSRLP
jgi:tRNA (guanine-N7-)-methyltransferase